MTIDRIHGESFFATPFVDGLVNWRSDLHNLSATRLNGESWALLIDTSGPTFGQLRINKSLATTTAIHHDPIPLKTGQYLEVSFDITLITGPDVQARIVGGAANNSGVIAGYTEVGPNFNLRVGSTTRVSAIVGSGARPGVDLAWDANVERGYFGFELVGANGCIAQISNMVMTDVTGFFLSTNGDWLDVRDYGAIGDGVTDCLSALLQADAEADGRALFIPAGDFFIGNDITIHSPIRAYGKLRADQNTAVMLAHNYDLETYVHAFKDENVGFEKAIQALFRFNDHNGLDLCGRRVALSKSVDVAALAAPRTTMRTHRAIYNGQIEAVSSNNWDNITVTRAANYAKSNALQLTGIDNAGAIPVGSHVGGTGVGREIFVTDVDGAAATVTISEQLFDAPATQNYTFTRFRFMLDFSGFNILSKFEARNIDFVCNDRASVMLLAYEGTACKFSHNWVHRPKNRGICSYANGCNGLTVESCNFSSAENQTDADKRQSIAITTHRNDMKIRNNRAEYFRHFAILGGGGHLVVGNHFFQGNPSGATTRTAGIVIMYKNAKSTIIGNYIDNCWLEFSDEQDLRLTNANSHFGNIIITGNIFQAHNVPNWFRYIKIAPHSTGQGINGFCVTSNTFSLWAGNPIDRAEAVDTSFGSIDLNDIKNLRFEDNSFSEIIYPSHCPATKRVSASASASWIVDFSNDFPFGAPATTPISVILGDDANASGMPKVATRQGNGGRSLRLQFSQSTSGTAYVTARCDQPE